MAKILLLGSGELGREVAISAKRLGHYVIACDSYYGAPAMQVADHDITVNMLDAKQLSEIIESYRPDYIVPEIEAIATEVLLEKEKQGYKVVPSARAVNLTMNRDRIRDRAAELGIKTAKYKYAHSLTEIYDAANYIGYPCVVKPVMSSSGKGQSVVNSVEEVAKSWTIAIENMRGARQKVIVEEFINFDIELTILTVKQEGSETKFCKAIGHYQEDGDYKHSWQPALEETFTGHIIEADARAIAKTITDDLGGSGIFGVEFFVNTKTHKPEVIFSELSPRPHDTGMVTLISQELNEFDLHVRAFTGLPIPSKINLYKNNDEWASATINIDKNYNKASVYNIENLNEILHITNDVKIFGKPYTKPGRRIGVLLGDKLEKVLKAQEVIKINVNS